MSLHPDIDKISLSENEKKDKSENKNDNKKEIIENEKEKEDDNKKEIIENEKKKEDDDNNDNETYRNYYRNAFMLRVNLEASNKAASEKMASFLKTVTEHQLEKSFVGVITYHFSFPLDQNSNYMEYTEVYVDEKNFWEHTNTPQIAELFSNTFQEKDIKNRLFSYVGPPQNVSPNLKNVLSYFNSTYPKSEAGYVLHDNYFKCLNNQDDSKLLMKYHFDISSKEKSNEIISNLQHLSDHARQHFASTFHCHKLLADILELINIWPSSNCLLKFINEKSSNKILNQIAQSLKSNDNNKHSCYVYGKINDQAKEEFEKIFQDVIQIKYINDFIGYITHPKANEITLKKDIST